MSWQDVIEATKQHFWWIVAGVIGRMMFHGAEARAGRRPFWGRELPFELVMAVGMAFVGKAFAAWWGLTGDMVTAVAGVAAYLGPRAIDVAFDKVAKKV